MKPWEIRELLGQMKRETVMANSRQDRERVGTEQWSLGGRRLHTGRIRVRVQNVVQPVELLPRQLEAGKDRVLDLAGGRFPDELGLIDQCLVIVGLCAAAVVVAPSAACTEGVRSSSDPAANTSVVAKTPSAK